MEGERESRRSRRESVFRVATIRLPGAAEPLTGRVRDVSDRGARIDVIAGLLPGLSIEIAIGAEPAVMAKIAWIADGKCGIVFDHAKVPAADAPAIQPDSAPTAGWMADMHDRYRR